MPNTKSIQQLREEIYQKLIRYHANKARRKKEIKIIDKVAISTKN